MRPAALAVCGLALAGCLTAPHHVPSSPAPSDSQCLEERALANLGREQMLESSDPHQRAITARAVLLHAECERLQLERMQLMARGLRELPAEIDRAVARYQAAVGLYDEAAAYGVRGMARLSLTGTAALHDAFARKLREIDLAGDLDPAERAAIREEVDHLAGRYERMGRPRRR